MIYIIDHQDSFTFNLAHLLSDFDDIYVTNYFEINEKKLLNSKLIVFSPGPGNPQDYTETSSVYKYYKGKKKILGICLGFQQILFNEKAKIIQKKRVLHGYQSKVKVLNNSKLFKKNNFYKVGNYNSLTLKDPFYSKYINITMRCEKTNNAMALEDITNQIYGFQFHPESFLTKNGKFFIQKIISA